MLVRQTDWDRMMDSIADIHDLAEKLADASARASKAETIADFEQARRRELEQRVQELTDALEAAQAAPEPSEPVEPAWSRLRHAVRDTLTRR